LGGALKPALAGIAAVGFALIARNLGAQSAEDPRAVQPERPTVATHAGTVAPGYFEIEAGVQHDRFAPGFTSGLAPIVLKFGAASHLQISAFGSIVQNDATTSIGDLALGAKWRLLDDAPVLGDFAILPSIKWPTGSAEKETGTGTTDVGLLLISSHSFGSVAMDINAGITSRSGDGSVAPKTAALWALSFGGPFDDRFGWVVEGYGYPGTGGSAGSRPIVALLGGPTLQVRKWLALDAGFIVPVAGPQPHSLYAGGVYNVGRF
jgi:hypothetical protein